MGFSGSGGLAASSSNCCCGRRRGRRRVSHSKKRSSPCPHETLCGAVTEAETAMVGDFLQPRAGWGWGEGGELTAAPATQAQRWPAPGTGPVLVGRRGLGMEDEDLPQRSLLERARG